MSGNLDNNATVQLYTFFVTFDDTICYCNSVTCLEARVLFAGSKCFFCNFNSIVLIIKLFDRYNATYQASHSVS